MSYHNTSTPSTPSTAQQSTTNAQGQAAPAGAQSQIAPAGFHYMPDGTLMSDALMSDTQLNPLLNNKIIRSFHIDFNDIKEAGETKRFSILGDNGAKFSLEVTNEDNKYYNFQTNLFQVAKTKLDNISISGSAYYGNITFPTARTTDTVNGAVTGGIRVIMDTAVASTMKVGDRVTGNALLDAGNVTVAALDPDDDNTSEFSLSEAIAIADGVTLSFANADKYDFLLFTGENTQHSNYNEVRFEDNSIDINSSTGSNSITMQKVIYQTLDVDITINGFSGSGLITSYNNAAPNAVTQTITTSRGKSVATIPLSISVSVAAGALTIDRQPVDSDIFSSIDGYSIGDDPVDIPRENIYPTVTFTDTSGVTAAVTSGAIVPLTSNVASNVVIGDKITTPVITDTANGDFSSGATAITMDAAVATKMAVGDQVTGNAVLDAGLFTVASIDSTNVFSLNSSARIDDGITLSFSSKINRDTTTVLNLNPSGEAKEFTMSQDIQFRDNAVLSFSNRRNYRWPISNTHLLTPGMRVKANTTNGFTDEVTIADYLDETIVFENDPKEQRFTNVKVPAIDTLKVKPTLTRNASTNVVATTQTGNITFNEQALKTLGSETIKIFGYGMDEINRITGYDVEFTDLKAELNTVTTTTTAAVSASTTIPVTSKVGIVDKTTQTVNGATTASADVVLDSVTGLGVGQSLYVGTGLVGTPTITAINETTKTITLSTDQTFADGITLTFPNSIISGIGIDPAVVNPYVDTISSLNLTASVAQTLEDTQTFTFTGAGNIVTITGFVKINKVGNDAVALRFDIDKFLTQH